jgi:hypothetical protein
VSDPDLDALAEAARNRGLKLVRSRVRTPGKRRFGKVGLTDAGGKPVLGMDAKGPTAKPVEVEEYLRNLGARDWGASLDGAVLPRKRGKAKAEEQPKAKPAKSAPKPKPKPKPQPMVREAKPADAASLVALIALLGASVGEKGVRKRVSALAKEQLPPGAGPDAGRSGGGPAPQTRLRAARDYQQRHAGRGARLLPPPRLRTDQHPLRQGALGLGLLRPIGNPASVRGEEQGSR